MSKLPTLEALAKRVQRARVRNAPAGLEDRAKRLLLSYLQTAHAHGISPKSVLSEMASGQVAWRIGLALHDEITKSSPPQVRDAACANGCAFCCILTEDEGGVITRFEAEQLFSALAPLQDQPDGRAWHPKACPALNPETRTCRAYEDRPMICRSFISTDAAACEANANGGTERGAGLLGSHLDYLAIIALCRVVLKGITATHTHSLASTAAAAIDGNDKADALKHGRHPTKVLDETLKQGLAASGVSG